MQKTDVESVCRNDADSLRLHRSGAKVYLKRSGLKRSRDKNAVSRP